MDGKNIDKMVGILGAGIGTAILIGGFISIITSNTTIIVIAGAIAALIGCSFQANIEK